ncbi:hypothetical protein M378DRAFT_967392 [Amanita muscaria Koide BX008]|uniref:Uncharacterized protein n=1 Tax=Amanita muscaria (strain Koide BX008) TaxID=946122 RepID=A0A0C2WTX8_AMAMK|nr:hypothetical protein M378DRAFT_967392 [Amanita muscaria Koide BX008]
MKQTYRRILHLSSHPAIRPSRSTYRPMPVLMSLSVSLGLPLPVFRQPTTSHRHNNNSMSVFTFNLHCSTSPTSLAITHTKSYKPSRRGQVPLSYYFFRTDLFMKAENHRATAVSLVLAGMHIGPPISGPLMEASTPPCTDKDKLEETIHPLYTRGGVSCTTTR